MEVRGRASCLLQTAVQLPGHGRERQRRDRERGGPFKAGEESDAESGAFQDGVEISIQVCTIVVEGRMDQVVESSEF